jgi:putative flavoprotein involved in K+ transport
VVDEAPGLYFLGMQCQYSYGSGLIWWVKDDAQYLLDQIRAYRAGTRPVVAGHAHS